MDKLDGIRVKCTMTTQEYPWAKHFRVLPNGTLKIYASQYGTARVYHPATEWVSIERLTQSDKEAGGVE